MAKELHLHPSWEMVQTKHLLKADEKGRNRVRPNLPFVKSMRICVFELALYSDRIDCRCTEFIFA